MPSAQHEGIADQGLPHQHHPRAQDLFLGLTRRARGSLMWWLRRRDNTAQHPAVSRGPFAVMLPVPPLGNPPSEAFRATAGGQEGRKVLAEQIPSEVQPTPSTRTARTFPSPTHASSPRRCLSNVFHMERTPPKHYLKWE